MNRNSGIGLTAFGIVLVAIGAILKFAVSVHTSGFNIHKVGDILLLVGILLVIFESSHHRNGGQEAEHDSNRGPGNSLRSAENRAAG
jgi:uncharacterized membrane protein YidH (DUF202 family)